jgi:hypothetical protein
VGVVAASTLLAYAHSILPLVLPVYVATVRLGKVYTCVTVVCGFDDAAADAAAVVVFADDDATGSAVHVAACSTFPVAAAHVWFPESVYPVSHVGTQCAPVKRIAGQFPRAPLVGAAVTHPPTQSTMVEEL